jgi:hypothetical protein
MGASLTRTQGTPTSKKKFTFSLWYKKTKIRDYGASSSDSVIFNSADGGGNDNRLTFYINQENSPYDTVRLVGRNSASQVLDVKTSAVLRDPGAWLHIVAKVDTTQSTNTDRAKLYINGVEQSLSISTYPNQDVELNIQHTPYLLSYSGSGNYLEGLITHYHYTDGYAYDASTFGETDSTSGIWKAKTSPSVTYGTNGFFLKFENGAAMGTDSSGQSNTFTASGSLTQNTDTPSNNLAYLNPLLIGTGTGSNAVDFLGGNTRCDIGAAVWRTLTSTLAVSSGKWYFEGFGTSQASAYQHYGITSLAKFAADAAMPDKEINEEQNGYAYGYYGNNGQIYYSTPSARSNGAYGSSYGASDYVGMFVDLDNNKLYVAKNGTLANSGTGYDINADGKPYFLAMSIYGAYAQINFGSGMFGYSGSSYANLTGTTYADANGHGVFKYSPNQGGASNFDSAAKNFYALNTKNLKEFG